MVSSILFLSAVSEGVSGLSEDVSGGGVVFNIEPSPVSSHSADIPYWITIFCNGITPTLLLPFVISVINEVLTPNFSAISFLSCTFFPELTKKLYLKTAL